MECTSRGRACITAPALVALALVGCGGHKQQPSGSDRHEEQPVASDPDPSMCRPSTLLQGGQTLTLNHGGIERSFLVHYPVGVDMSRPLPLVFNFHGLGSHAQEQATYSGFGDKADSEEFIVVHPEGVANANGSQAWNSGICCADDKTRDDVGFVRAMLKELKQRACVDPRRVYAAGMSNGGHMAHRLGCEAADVIAAIASVTGILLTPFDGCKPSRAIPVLDFHGTADMVVPYEGGTTKRGLQYPSVEAVMSGWAERNGCNDQPTESLNQKAALCETYSQCTAGVQVTLCSMSDMGHCWPGAGACSHGAPVNDVSATDKIWDFFRAVSLP